MVDDDLVDPLDEPEAETNDGDDMDGVVEDFAAPSDNLDVEIVDEFDEDDFDEEFDDDFEEEIVGEYDLEDDQYGEEFNAEFGHLTDPSIDSSKKSADPKKTPDKKKK